MIITDYKTFSQVFEDFYLFDNTGNPVAFDIETDGVKRYGTNIYGFGLAFSPSKAVYIALKTNTGVDFFSKKEQTAIIQTIDSLFKTNKIIGHNLVFDLIHWENFSGYNYFDYVHADTILMRHLLNEEGPFGLKEIGLELYGADAVLEQEELFKNIEKNGGKTNKNDCQFYLADTEVLGRYCMKDALLTYRIYNDFLKQIHQENLYQLFQEEIMPLYRLVTLPMNKHGLKINVDLLKQIQTEITKDLLDLETKIIKTIEKDIADIEEDILSKSVKLTPRGDFGKLYAEMLGITEFNKKSLEKLNVQQNAELEAFVHFYMTGDPSLLPRKDEVRKKIFFIKNPDQHHVFNLRSKQHLQRLFFDKLKLKPTSYTDKNQPQVNEEFLESIADQFSWVKDLLILNKLEKLKGTYIDGVLERIENEHYIYPSMLQFGTTSGRFSSKNPNCQNLPRPFEEPDKEHPLVVKYNDIIRKMFISNDGYVFVDADYTALEPHCFAHMSGDKNLQQIFINREDMYSSIAKRVFNLKDVSVFKKDENFLGKKYPAYRQQMKVVALATVYGASAFRISKLLNSSVKEAENIINNYFKAYPNLKNYIDDCHNSAKKFGFVRTIFGRKRRLTKVKEHWNMYGHAIENKDEISERNLWEEAKLFKNLLNNSTNFPIQGLAAHIVNRAMIKMTQVFRERNLDAQVVLQIHDQIVVECKEEIAEEVKVIVKESMENVVELSVPLHAEPKIAHNLKDSH